MVAYTIRQRFLTWLITTFGLLGDSGLAGMPKAFFAPLLLVLVIAAGDCPGRLLLLPVAEGESAPQAVFDLVLDKGVEDLSGTVYLLPPPPGVMLPFRSVGDARSSGGALLFLSSPRPSRVSWSSSWSSSSWSIFSVIALASMDDGVARPGSAFWLAKMEPFLLAPKPGAAGALCADMTDVSCELGLDLMDLRSFSFCSRSSSIILTLTPPLSRNAHLFFRAVTSTTVTCSMDFPSAFWMSNVCSGSLALLMAASSANLRVVSSFIATFRFGFRASCSIFLKR
mmetsp:Transcript_6878/g.20261  ORF Transcript_6878/g.20261 Transcript_6878/m.20261 type:complete len:283 (-) Transcript_6878:466-1314(-)